MTNIFAELLYVLRKEKGWTQSELADKLGITNKAVSKWETGEAFPDTAQLVPLATVFNITVDELLRGRREDAVSCEAAEPQRTLTPYTKKQTASIAVSVGLLLFSVMLLITLATNGVSYGIFVPIFLTLVAAAVFILVLTSFERALNSAAIDESAKKKGERIALMLSIGISVTILSVIPIIIMDYFGISESVYLPIFFSILIISVPVIVFSGMQWGQLTKSYGIPTDEEPPLTGRAKEIEGAVCGVIMLLATGIFLLLGFLRGLWHPAWVAFPIGGICCGIASTIIKAFANKR